MKHPVHLIDATKNIDLNRVKVDDAEVAQRIKDAVESMEERGLPPLSYPEIAKLCEVSEKNVWNWAREGKISKAKLPTLAAILGVTVEYLLTGVSPVLDLQLQAKAGTYELRNRTDTIRIVPVLEPRDFVTGLAASDVLGEKLQTWAKEPQTYPMASLAIVDESDPGVPSFAMQMTTGIFEDVPKGTLLFFSHRLVPRNGEFSIWLTRKPTVDGSKLVVVGGYTAYEAIPDSFPVGVPMGDLTPLSKVHLQCVPFRSRPDDITLEPCTIDANGTVHATRRLLGTLVATFNWLQPQRMRAQTYLETRLKKIRDTEFNDRTKTVYDL